MRDYFPRVLLCVGLLQCLGCCRPPKPDPIPAYPWTDHASALQTIAARLDAVRTVSAQCDLTLTRPDGQAVRLDGALVMRAPDWVRMRAWKFSQAVFDLTLTPQGAWALTPDDPGRRQKVLPASANAARMARAWSLFGGAFFKPDDRLKVVDDGGPVFGIERTLDDGQVVSCQIDRATLTPRQYALASGGAGRFVLRQQRYRLFNGIAWPTEITARGEGGTIQIDLRDVTLNGELEPAAFVPPRRAQKLP